MSIDFCCVHRLVFAKPVVVFALVSFIGSLAAQTAEPDYQFDFIAETVITSDGVQAGVLDVSVLPPQLHQVVSENSEPAVPVVLNLDATLFPGRWLVASDSDNEGPASEQEEFVRGKFTLFQTAEQPEQYQQWLDPETYSTFLESVAGNEIDLASDRQFYLQYDNIRLLGSIRYGVYILLYTQFRSAETEQLTTSVMPARYLDGRLVTAGSLHASSHELYRLLAFGTLQRQLMIYLEERVKN